MEHSKINTVLRIVNFFLTFVVTILTFATIMSGCGAGTEVNSTADYEAGKIEPGWLVGMSPEEMKKFYDGITDSDVKKRYADLYFKYMEANLQTNTSAVEIGKIIINNETNYSVTLGIEGPIEKSWTFTGKGTVEEIIPPGEYKQYSERNGKKKYKMNTVYYYKNGKKKSYEEYDMLNISPTSTASFNGRPCSGVLNFHNR